MSEVVQVLPMPKVHPIWEHPGVSRYPETIKVSFTDGKVITYHIDADLPHPCCVAINEGMERMEGYTKGKLPRPLSV